MAADRKRETRMTRSHMALYHALLLGVLFLAWHLLTNPLLVSEEFARTPHFSSVSPCWCWSGSGIGLPVARFTNICW